MKLKMKDGLKPLIRQFIKFGLVGLSNTAISLSVYYLFLWIDESLYLVGHTAGFIISVLNAYFWNSRFVFEKKEKGHKKTLFRTYITYGSTLLLGLFLLWIMVEQLHISETIAPLINLLITTPVNFLLNKFWTYK